MGCGAERACLCFGWENMVILSLRSDRIHAHGKHGLCSCNPRPSTVDQRVISTLPKNPTQTLSLPPARTAVFDMSVVPYLDDALCISAGYEEASHIFLPFFPSHEELGTAIPRAGDDGHSSDPVRVCFDHPYCCCRGIFFLSLVTRASAPSETVVILEWKRQRLRAWVTSGGYIQRNYSARVSTGANEHFGATYRKKNCISGGIGLLR